VPSTRDLTHHSLTSPQPPLSTTPPPPLPHLFFLRPSSSQLPLLCATVLIPPFHSHVRVHRVSPASSIELELPLTCPAQITHIPHLKERHSVSLQLLRSHWTRRLTWRRYVGTLVEINSEASTVSLDNVRSFGTEGRKGGKDEYPPSDVVYEQIVFRGSDVKDLRIEESAKEKAPPAMPQDPAIIGVSLFPLLPTTVDDVTLFGCKSLNHRERKTMWIFSVAFLLRPFAYAYSTYSRFKLHLLTQTLCRYHNLSLVKRALRKTSSVSSSSNHRTSLHMASSHRVAILPLAALVAQEVPEVRVVHTRIASARKVDSREDQDRSLGGHLAHLACRHLEHHLQAGFHQVKALISLLAPSHLTCRRVLLDCTTRASRRPDRGAVHRRDSNLPKMTRLLDNQRLPRQTVCPNHQSRSEVRSQQDLLRPQLQRPSRLHHHPSIQSRVLLLRSLLRMRSQHNKLELKEDKVDNAVDV
jgi:hypothetical protein